MNIFMPVFTDLSNDYRVYRTATTLAALNHQVTVFGVQYPHSAALRSWGKGINLIRIPIAKNQGKWRYLYFNWQIARYRADHKLHIIHANDLDTLAGSVMYAKLHKIPLIYDSHEHFCEQETLKNRWKEKKVWELTERLLIKQARRVITVSEGIAEALLQKYNIEPPMILRNLPPYQHIQRTNKIHDYLKIRHSTKIVLYQGGLLVNFGLEKLIQMAEYLADAILVFIGSGPEESRLKQIVDMKNLSGKVRFIPQVPFQELLGFTASADVGLVMFAGSGQSIQFSLPNKLFEYLMAGLPVVASPYPEIRKIVEKYQVGLLADINDPKQTASEIDCLLNDPDQLFRFKANARKAAEVLNWDQERIKLTELYNELSLIKKR